ncbi:pantetheine-phosphate adenylyltransferase [Halosquirtibacter xylanolyticus]|uniref:pantetheine-phosphate adenylyltransferase n=1 Tax=Halosquirtibacter xylanolyticus TaxID=3374599 RepID=UPI0037483A62|nr:pantetheine-phosphate adenylyltransferase [Prolixibacteraceae bacterium]
MSRIAVFPGSFDPFTIGHESIVRRALPLFDQVIIMIGYNSEKRSFFPLEKRVEWIEKVFSDTSKVTVATHEGLTVDFCRKVNSNHILRGLRTAADFEYERAIAQVNKKMEDDLETVFLLTTPEHTPVTSTIVRDILRHKGDVSMFLPSNITMKDLADYVG